MNLLALVSLMQGLMLQSFKQKKCYPTLANSVPLPTFNGAWTLGTKTEIIPASTITSDFTIDELNVELAAADDYYEIVLYTGAASSEVEFARVRYKGTGLSRVSIGYANKFIPANTRISASVARKTAAASINVTVSVSYRLQS